MSFAVSQSEPWFRDYTNIHSYYIRILRKLCFLVASNSNCLQSSSIKAPAFPPSSSFFSHYWHSSQHSILHFHYLIQSPLLYKRCPASSSSSQASYFTEQRGFILALGQAYLSFFPPIYPPSFQSNLGNVWTNACGLGCDLNWGKSGPKGSRTSPSGEHSMDTVIP